MRSPMQLFFIDASYASPSTSVAVNAENYWEFPPIGNAGGLYHAKFQTINKQKITVLGDPLSSASVRRSKEPPPRLAHDQAALPRSPQPRTRADRQGAHPDRHSGPERGVHWQRPT